MERYGDLQVPAGLVTTTFGQQVNAAIDGTHVFVGTLQVLSQTRRLRIAQTLAAVRLLVQELENFRVKITAGRHETIEAWRCSQHDDLVLAVALAAWVGEFAPPGLDEPPDDETTMVLITR